MTTPKQVYDKEFQKNYYRQVNLKKTYWQILMNIRSRHPEIRGMSETIGYILAANKKLVEENKKLKELIDERKNS